MDSSLTLTELEKTILNRINYYINENKRVNIQTIADDCFVSKGAVVKLAKKLGFSGYSEMYYVTLAAREKTFAADYSGVEEIFQNSKSQEYIKMFYEQLWQNRNSKIYIDSLGICDTARDYYLQKLLIFEFNASICYHFEAFHVHNPGLYIFLSYSGTNSGIIDKVKVAADNGFKVIALTANPNSPLGKLADYTFNVTGSRSDKYDYMPDLFTANLIILFELVLSEYSQKYLKPEKAGSEVEK
jgi:DNA-binding MurR/RpiR family transcriptional regulator